MTIKRANKTFVPTIQFAVSVDKYYIHVVHSYLNHSCRGHEAFRTSCFVKFHKILVSKLDKHIMFELRKCFLILSLVWFQLDAQNIAKEINENSTTAKTATKFEDSELIFAHILFRHGDRNPIMPFPTDPWKNESFWPRGYGSLTNVSFIFINCLKN